MAGQVWLDGASGFVGRALMRDLIGRGVSVRPISRHKCEVLGIQAVSPSEVGGLIEPGDRVIASAGLAHVNSRSLSWSDYRQANVDSPVRLAEAAARSGASRLVYISSVKVMGEKSSPGNALSEDDPANPQGLYARSKWEAEQALRSLARDWGLEITTIRPPLVYGPGVRANFRAMMDWLYRGIPLPLASVANRRSLVALDNLVDFVSLCLSHPDAANETFVCCDEVSMSTPELLRCVADGLGCRARLWPCPEQWLRVLGRLFGYGDSIDRLTESFWVDSRKAQQLLGWQPPVSCRQALSDTALAYRRELNGR